MGLFHDPRGGSPTTKTQTKNKFIVLLKNEKGLFHDPKWGSPTTKTQTKINLSYYSKTRRDYSMIPKGGVLQRKPKPK